MKRDFLEPLYNCFDSFIANYLISKNSFLTDEQSVLHSNYIDEAINCFVDNYDDSAASFEDKVSKQFANATLQSKLNFAHAEWLWNFSVGDISQWRKEDYIKRRIGILAKDLQPGIFPI